MANRFGADILIQAPDAKKAALFYVSHLGFEITDNNPKMIGLHGRERKALPFSDRRSSGFLVSVLSWLCLSSTGLRLLHITLLGVDSRRTRQRRPVRNRCVRARVNLWLPNLLFRLPQVSPAGPDRARTSGIDDRMPVAFAGRGPSRSGMCASGTGDGRKEARPRPDR
jgi:hypothetical protein